MGGGGQGGKGANSEARPFTFNAIDFRAFTVSGFFFFFFFFGFGFGPAFTLARGWVHPWLAPSDSLTKFLSEVQFTLRALTEKLST